MRRQGSIRHAAHNGGSKQRSASKTAAASTQATLLIDDLGGRGDGVGRLPSGEVVFVAGTAPGDRVEVEIKGRRGGVLRGTVIRLEPGTQRVTPMCAVAERCGGCSWLHVSTAAQTRVKASIARRTLASFGHSAAPLQVGSVPSQGWRRRARVHLRDDHRGLAVGFLAGRSEDLVGVESCPALESALNAKLPALAQSLKGVVTKAEVAMTVGVEGVVAEIRGVGRGPDDDEWAAITAGFAGVRMEIGGQWRAYGADVVTLVETAGTAPVRASATGFSQASAAGNEAILAATRQALAVALVDGGGRVGTAFEAYAGSGNLTSLLLEVADAVMTVESDPAACDRARVTYAAAIADGRLNVRSEDADDVEPPGGDACIWLVDPGRPGAQAIVGRLREGRPSGLIYVSCAPDTLRRDGAAIVDAGYRLAASYWIDSMPGTPHLEIVTAWVREGVPPTTVEDSGH